MTFPNHCARLFCTLLAVSPLFAQCYDLGSTRLYQPEGRFQERWKDSDFRLDKSEWGDAQQFALFAGIARKTAAGWMPFRVTRRPLYLCEPGLRPDGGLKCYWQPYDTPTPQATLRRYHPRDEEVWTLSKEGVLKYERHQRGTFQPIESHESDTVATLDLNAGTYAVEIKIHASGVHRHLKKEGIELWREQPFKAVARLTPVACPATVDKAAWASGGREPQITEMNARAPCVVKVTKLRDGGIEAIPTEFLFVLNPYGVSSPDGCVVVQEGPPPRQATLALEQGMK